jgi:hypothetical protein
MRTGVVNKVVEAYKFIWDYMEVMGDRVDYDEFVRVYLNQCINTFPFSQDSVISLNSTRVFMDVGRFVCTNSIDRKVSITQSKLEYFLDGYEYLEEYDRLEDILTFTMATVLEELPDY